MPLNDAVARWCPTLDPAYGTTTLTDLIGGVGNFSLPSNSYWGTSGSFKHLNWSVDWSTSRSPGPASMQSSAASFTFSHWMNRTAGIPWASLRSSQSDWWGWYSNRSVRANDFSGSFASSGASLPNSTWGHVVLRQVAGSHVIYSVNGVHGSPSTSLSNLTGFTDFRLCLGASQRSGATDNYFRGQQDDFIVYSRALTDDEVVALYGRGRGGSLANVLTSRRRRATMGAGIL